MPRELQAAGIAACVIGASAAALGQVRQAWVASYDGPANRWDSVDAMAVDAVGNVYVTGRSDGGATALDYATIKYDAAGNRLWLARFDGPASGFDYANALAVDGAGNVFVAGNNSTSRDFNTVKYDSDGHLLWARSYQGSFFGYHTARALAVDAQGNAYVTGDSIGASGAQDISTIKYGPDGQELWVRRYDGPDGGDERAYAIALGPTGNSYVAGRAVRTGGQSDFITIKYSADGNEDWVRFYDGPGRGWDEALALAVDGADNAHVTGVSRGVVDQDIATVKYDAAGEQLWAARYDSGTEWDDPRDIAVDTNGNVYVTGSYSYGRTIKYDASGAPAWVSPIPGTALALDELNNAYVAAYELAWPSQTTVKLDTDGHEVWRARYDPPAGQVAIAYHIALDNARNVCIAGYVGVQGPGLNFLTIQYTQTPPCPGDLDGDRTVSLTDLAVLLTNFGTPGGALPSDGDTDYDGDVDLQDLATLLSVFGTTCP